MATAKRSAKRSAKKTGSGGASGASATESPIERSAREAATENEAVLTSLLAAIREHVREIGARFYDIGLALKQIVDQKLYAVRGHASLAALVKAERLVSPRQAVKLVAVARKVKREHALSLGLEKTYALLGYTDATPAADSVAGLLEEGATVLGKPARRLGVREIAAATRAERATAGEQRPATEKAKAKAKAKARMASAVAAAMRAGGLPKGAVTVGAARVRIDLPRAAVERWLAKR